MPLELANDQNQKNGYIFLKIHCEVIMKSQKHNQGDLKEVTVSIEKKVAEDLEVMAKNTGMTPSEIIVIALKRFRSSHSDYLKQAPPTE